MSRFDFFFRGTNHDDVMHGTNSRDKMVGKKGNDVMYGLDGDDMMFGGKGHDKMYGGKGNDVMFGGKGNDVIFGEQGNDVIFGGKGNDEIHGGVGDDVMFGGAGNDTFIFDSRLFAYDPITGAPYVVDPVVVPVGGDPGIVPLPPGIIPPPPGEYLSGGKDIVHGGSGKDTIVLRGDNWVIDIQHGHYNHNDGTHNWTAVHGSLKGVITNTVTGAEIKFDSIEQIKMEF